MKFNPAMYREAFCPPFEGLFYMLLFHIIAIWHTLKIFINYGQMMWKYLIVFHFTYGVIRITNIFRRLRKIQFMQCRGKYEICILKTIGMIFR